MFPSAIGLLYAAYFQVAERQAIESFSGATTGPFFTGERLGSHRPLLIRPSRDSSEAHVLISVKR